MKTLFAFFIWFSVIVIGVYYHDVTGKNMMNLAAILFWSSLLFFTILFLLGTGLLKMLLIILGLIAIFNYLDNVGFARYINKLYNKGVTVIHYVATEISEKSTVYTDDSCDVCITRSKDDNTCVVCGDE